MKVRHMFIVLRDAWTTLAPRPDDRHGPLQPLLLALTVVTGVIDAFSYLALGHVFVANMTGNVVFIAFATAGAAGFSVTASLLALAAFGTGALIGGRLAGRTRAHRGRLLRAALTLQTVLVLAAFAGAGFDGAPYAGSARNLLIALLGLAMGIQNAAARALAVPDLNTTVLTMTITGLAADTPGGRTGRRLLAVAGLFLGGLFGAIAALHGRPALPLLLAASVLAAAVGTAYVLARSGAPWTRPM